MRKKKEYPSECPSWLDTYSDMVTLMLTFFVLLFAMSTMSSAKWQKLVKAF
jgi:chemotaxis protein MotB